MKILVLGGSGMLGHKVFQTLRARFPETYCTIREPLHSDHISRVGLFDASRVVDRFDVRDLALVESFLSELRPTFIVNCIGVVKQRSEAHDAVSSILINSLLPHKLAEITTRWGGRVIHFSTDCVFNGKRGEYTESDIPDAEDLYGRTKALGEVTTDNALTLRTSIIGRELSHHSSLLEWFLAQRGRTIRGFTRAIYSGVTTNLMARIVAECITRQRSLSGLYQVTGQTITKYDLLCVLREAFRLDIEITPDDSFVCDRSMSGEKFEKATAYVAPPWKELAAELANDPTPYATGE
ncbi:MAG TPA: SDR family oxidoreductase [Terriglobales bacterium]|nr:SDR family oxidoreductase [Terriglobales bacterium]